MKKADLIEKISTAIDRSHSKKDIETILTAFFDETKKAILQGDKVELSGICTLSAKDVKERIGRNIRTGEPITIQAHKKLHCSTSGVIKAALKAL